MLHDLSNDDEKRTRGTPILSAEGIAIIIIALAVLAVFVGVFVILPLMLL